MTERRKRRMLEFVLDEVSAVDVPAQRHALALISKSGGDADHVALGALSDSLRSIAEDTALSAEQKQAMRERSLREFGEAIGTENTMDRPQSFEAAVAAIRSAEGLSGMEAMRVAHKRHPALFEKMQTAATNTEFSPELGKSVRVFETLVAKIASERKITKMAAMRVARQEHPSEFAAFQAA
jgi:hypothetical protein